MTSLGRIGRQYTAGIRRGIEQQRIVLGNRYPYTDIFAHIDGHRLKVLDDCNTRSLDKTERSLVEMAFKHNDSIKILELGPGAGKTLSDIHSISSEKGREVSLDTASLTPLSPRMQILMTAEEMTDTITGYIASGERSTLSYHKTLAIIERFYPEQKVGASSVLDIFSDSSSPVPLGLAFALQEHDRVSFPFFRSLRKDFIRTQYIIDLNREPIQDGTYDLILDKYGPLSDWRQKGSTILSQLSGMLSDNGLLRMAIGNRALLDETAPSGYFSLAMSESFHKYLDILIFRPGSIWHEMYSQLMPKDMTTGRLYLDSHVIINGRLKHRAGDAP